MSTQNSIFDFDISDNRINAKNSGHYHDSFEIYYLTSGECRYFIDKKTYKLTEGDIVVIPPGIIHNTFYESDLHTRILINCSGDYIPPSVLKNIKNLVYVMQTHDTAKRIESIYKRIQKAIEEPDEYTEDSVKCYVMSLLLTIARASTDEYKVKTGSPFIEKAVYYIRKNYTKKLTLSETAKYCAVSAEHLSRAFKKETGFGFNEYLNIYRLKKAEALLKGTEKKTIAEIAYRCGFNDSNYFSTAYKNMYNISPSKVRRQNETEYDDVL